MTPFHARGQPRVFRIPFGSTPRSRVLIAGPETDVQGPVWVDCYSPAPGWRIPPGYSPYSPLFSNYSPTTPKYSPAMVGEYKPVFSIILHYSPIILQRHQASILHRGSRALPGASRRRWVPQKRLWPPNGAARRRRAPGTADQCRSALSSSDQFRSDQISSDQL